MMINEQDNILNKFHNSCPTKTSTQMVPKISQQRNLEKE